MDIYCCEVGRPSQSTARLVIILRRAGTDKAIDAMVYKLYGLNEEEIGIVKGIEAVN